MSLTYARYLELDALLSLQRVQSDPPEHDETLFIVIHQVYELWFKLLLHEFDRAKAQLTGDDLFGAIDTFGRVRTVMKTLVGQLDILETMTPLGFSTFRRRLDTASGFQSSQFRELEFLLGYKREAMIEHHRENAAATETLRRRLVERSIVDHFYDFLAGHGATIPRELRDKPPTSPTQAHPLIEDEIERMYRTDKPVAILLERMTDFDEGFQEWRYRHVKMVERTIGFKMGTGGSSGAEFLRSTLFKPVFPDLWNVRKRL